MQIASMHFKARAHANMANAQLQHNLQKIRGKFVDKRRESLTELDDFEGTREAGRAIRQRALDDLDVWLEIFERNATARGATVLWAETPDEINAHVLDIARRHGARKMIKSKSMVSEESALDRAIEAAGLTVVETDLGEYILQINDYEPPSHLIGPALHKSKEEVADLFAKAHATARKTEIAEHDGIGAAGRNVLAFVVGKPRRYFAKFDGERTAKSAASLALGHLDELQAPYAREQRPRLALDAHLAQARAGIVLGDSGRKRPGHGLELEDVLEKVGLLTGLGRKRTRALEQLRVVAKEIGIVRLDHAAARARR